MTLPDDTKPSAEAKEAAKDIRVELLAAGMEGNGVHLPAGTLAIIAIGLDRFRAAERERCEKIARRGAELVRGNEIKFVTPAKYAADLADDIADAIRLGEPPQ